MWKEGGSGVVHCGCVMALGMDMVGVDGSKTLLGGGVAGNCDLWTRNLESRGKVQRIGRVNTNQQQQEEGKEH
jgi:hypothetical protein